MVAKLEEAIAKVESDLEKARAAGDQKKVTELEDNLASRQAFLEMARARLRGVLRLKPAALTEARGRGVGRRRLSKRTTERARS